MAMTKNDRAASWLDGVMRGPFGEFFAWMVAKPCTDAEIAAAMSTNRATVTRARALLASKKAAT